MTAPGPVPPSSPQAQAVAAAAAADELEAKIVKLSIELRELEIKLKVSGEVTARSADGTVRIKTPEGEIEIRLPPGQPTPRVGEKVSVEIDPGDPPQTARITREAPAQTDTPSRGSQTPVDIQVRGERPVTIDAPRYAPADPTRPAQPPQSPAPGQPVELEALPYPPVSVDPLEIITSIVTQTPEIQAQTIIANLEDEVAQNLKVSVQTLDNSESRLTTPSPGLASLDPPLPIGERAGVRGVDASAQIIPKPFLNFMAPPPAITTQAFTPPQAVTLPGEDALPLKDIPFTPLKFTARIATITPPQIMAETQKPLILQNNKAETITGKVIALTPEKFPVIAFPPMGGAPESFFLMRIPAPGLPVGTEIAFTPELPTPAPTPGAQAVNPAAIPAPLAFLTPGPWPLMDEIYETLSQYMPRAAQAFSNVTPSPVNPAQLGPAALFFIAAVNGGDLTQWLGDKGVEALRRAGRAGLISRLGAEGNALNRLASEPVSGEWRAVSLPMFWQGEMQKVTLYFRHDSYKESEDESGGKQVRFIFDLNLDNMGDVQLDGLFRPRKLDLIVRTKQPFSEPMRMKMMQAYISALEPTEVRGELSFQSKPEQWVTIKASGRTFGSSA